MKGNMKKKDILLKIGIPIIWIGIWQLAASLLDQPLYLPSPILTFNALIIIIVKASFWSSIFYTYLRVLAGLLISIIVGILTGIAAAKIKMIYIFLEPLLTVMKTVPVMSVIILALVWFSSGNVPIFVCVLLCFPIMYTNTVEGIKNIDKNLLEMASVFSVSRKRVFFNITLPSLKPYIFTGIMVCIGFSWKSVVTAEVLSSPKFSIGYNLYSTKIYLDTPELFAWTLVVIIFSILIERFIKRLFASKQYGKVR